MYKKAIDILVNGSSDLEAIAIQIAKSNPSIFVKAFLAISEPSEPEKTEEQLELEYREKRFADQNILNFKDTLKIDDFLYKKMIMSFGHKDWLGEVMYFLFGRCFDRPETIKAIKAVRAGEGIRLREAKHFVEDLISGDFEQRSSI